MQLPLSSIRFDIVNTNVVKYNVMIIMSKFTTCPKKYGSGYIY
jgi:hypothetical protein